MPENTAERLSEVAEECEMISDLLMQVVDEITETLIEKDDVDGLLARIPQQLTEVFIRTSDELVTDAMRKALDTPTE